MFNCQDFKQISFWFIFYSLFKEYLQIIFKIIPHTF